MNTPFGEFAKALDSQIQNMIGAGHHLYVVAADKDKLWEIYLGSFPERGNPMYRQRTEHDCSACKNFVRSFGAVVTIDAGRMTSIWDFIAPGRYGPVAVALAAYIHSCPVADVFVTDQAKFGLASNHEMLDSGTVTTWEHMHAELPAQFVSRGHETVDTIRGKAHSLKDVFKRSLEDISPDAVATVLELISQNSLYKGEEWKGPLTAFRGHQVLFQLAPDKDLYAWEHAHMAGQAVGKIKNHSIGVLLMDISAGMGLDKAVGRYEKMVAPSNYMRPKALVTERMVREAEATVTELGFLSSLPRRFARLDDITVNNILFVDRDTAPKIRGGNVFSELAKSAAPKKFDRLEEVPLDTFLMDILPNAQKVEILLENRHSSNMLSLIAPQDRNSLSMFKWPNGFSWAYAGNMTDSMRQRVKALGGNVDGVLRFSIQWNEHHDNPDDLDAHCIEPNRNEIFFPNKRRIHPSSGVLDVDIIVPAKQAPGGVAVENITYSDISKMPGGTYEFFVYGYTNRGSRSGFTAEVEFGGQIYSFAYNQPVRQSQRVDVAHVALDKKTGQFSIIEKIPSQLASRKIWGLDTQQFHEASIVMFSPNYWNGDGIGNRHIFFMLMGAKNPEQPNGFFNEFLKAELLEHKRVFEALGSKMRVADSDEQLSGVGFSTTQRNEITVRVTGQTTRIIKVKI